MSVSDQELVGRVIADKYRLDKLVARGGFSSVFRGTHLGIDRSVAVKVLPLGDGVEATWIERFSREAKVISQLTHPNTITIFDFGRVGDEFFYLVMEYVRGRSLSRYIKKFGPAAPDKTARFAIQIARALDEAHHQGIVHRDLKPSNIMVSLASSGEESIKVLDFGVAKLLDPVPDVDIQLTQVGAFVGTPRYASPEQLRREKLDHRSDIYGLGMIMWESLVGEPAVEPTDYGGCIQYHLGPEPWRLPPGFDIPDKLAEIVHKSLEKERANRYLSCGQMADALEEFVGTYHYGKTERISGQRVGTLDLSLESQEFALVDEIGSEESAAEVVRPPEYQRDDQNQRDDDLFGDLVDTSEASDSFDDISEVFDFEDDGRDPDDGESSDPFLESVDLFDPDAPAPEPEPDFLQRPASGTEGLVARRPPPTPRAKRPKQPEQRRRTDWDPGLDDEPFADPPKRARAPDKPPADKPRSSNPRSSNPAPAARRPSSSGIPQAAVTKILGGVVAVILVVVASIVIANVGGGSTPDTENSENDYLNQAEEEVAAMLEQADQPAKPTSDGTPTISARALIIALNHDGWRASEQSENDLGDLQQISMMVRKEEMAASVTIYSTRSVNISEELLAATKSPSEGITFGSTMVRVSPGPSSAKSGVTPVIAHLYRFKNLVREEAGK